ncbi:MAG: ribonuclease HI [Clostridia bacterium]|nr:ribonuclease HI [Clostridia bacterium]
MIKKQVEIYTDGACSGNPGAGGWAAVLLYKDFKREISGAEEQTTNNRMELTAIIKGLQMLKEPCKVTVYSDSAYSVEPFLKNWIEGWIMRGWRTASKEDVKNVDLWKELLSLMQIHEVSFVKVKGHADNELNNRCDKLAVTAYKELQKKQALTIPFPDAPKQDEEK